MTNKWKISDQTNDQMTILVANFQSLITKQMTILLTKHDQINDQTYDHINDQI